MRVQVVEALTQESSQGTFSDANVERALKNFFAAVDSDDSLFSAESAGVQSAGAGQREAVCVGMLTLKFRDERLAQNRASQFSLLENLSELLKQAGSADSLTVTLALQGAVPQAGQQQFSLSLGLEARADSAEQAALRWALGLAHVQQALLFTSRLLRQQLSQRRD